MEIKNKLSLILDSFKILVDKKAYLLLAALLSIGLFFFFLFIINIPLFLTAINFAVNPLLLFKIFSNIMNTIINASGHAALVSFALVTILAGINISLLAFKYRLMKSSGATPLLSFGGIFGGGLAAGCPSCSISLLSLFGISGGLALLPLRGIEFSILGIIALLFSIYYISKSLRSCKACQIYFKKT